MRAILRLLSTAAYSVLLAACASAERGSDVQPLPPGAAETAVLNSLPDLKSLPEAARSGSAVETLVLQGDEASSTGGASSPGDPTALTLNPSAAELSYAIYSFALPEETETIGTLAVELLELGEAGDCFIAISNFSRQRWEFVDTEQLSAGAQTLADTTQRSAPEYSSPAGSCFLAVLAFDDASLTIDQVTLVTGLPLLPPADVSTNGIGAQLTFPDHIEISWTPAAGADGYQLFARLTSAGPDEPFTLVESIAGGESNSYVHEKINDNFFLPHKAEVEYRMKSLSGVEESLLFSNSSLGMRSIPPPLIVDAIDQAHTDLIFLNWTAVPEASSYFVYLDSQLDPVAETSDTFVSVTIEDKLPHNFTVTTVGSDGEGLFFTQSSEPASCADWEIHLPLSDEISNASRPALAIIAGRPAIAFVDEVNDLVLYARSTVAEPNATADWQVSEAAQAAVPFPLGLVQHGGKPWVLYFDQAAGLLCAAFADDGEPSSQDDWNSYSILEADIASPGIRLAEINGLLRFLYQDSAAQGGQVLIYYALLAEPGSSEDWALDIFSLEAINSLDFDIAQIAGGTGVVFEKDVAVYQWTAEAHPDELSDWTVSDLPESENLNSFRAFDLLETPDGRPSILARYRDFGGPSQFTTLLQAKLAVPVTQSDWHSGDTGFAPELSGGTAHCYFNGRALAGFILNFESVRMSSALTDPPENRDSSWARYVVDPDVDNPDFGGPLSMVVFDGRPAAVYSEDNGSAVFLKYARLLPLP